MSNSNELLNELQVLINDTSTEVFTELTGDTKLAAENFRLRFVDTFAERLREKARAGRPISDSVFNSQDKLEQLGWTQVETRLAEFTALVDYEKKQYASAIPRAYYMKMFYDRVLDNVDAGLEKGLYKYYFLDGEEMTHTEEMGSGTYSHMFLQSDRIESLADGIKGAAALEFVFPAEEGVEPKVLRIDIDPDDADPHATARYIIDEAFGRQHLVDDFVKIGAGSYPEDVTVADANEVGLGANTLREINQQLKDGTLVIERADDDKVIDATEQFQERTDAADSDRLDASIQDLEKAADSVSEAGTKELQEMDTVSAKHTWNITDLTTTVSGASYIDQVKDIRRQFESSGWTFPNPASIGEETMVQAVLAEKQIHVQLREENDNLTLFVALEQLRKQLLAPVSEGKEILVEAEEMLGRKVTEVTAIIDHPEAFTNDTDQTHWQLVFA